ncbi:MAG: TIR domain-containing protein [Sphingomicrobium sp.]
MSAESNQPAIFLSYAHDDRLKAQDLAVALARRGYTLWWDELIEGGAQFARSIRDALEAADAVVVLWSAKSIESDWVQDEAAQGRDRKRLVPVSLDGSQPPLGFRQYQTIDVSGSRGKPSVAKIEAIDRAIRAAIGGPARAPVRAPVATSRRGVLALGAGAVAIAVAGGGVAWQRGLFGGYASGDSIAVLPFKNVGGDPGQAYLSDGLTDEVRSALTRNPALRVLAATSSNTARDHVEDAVTIAARLGVSYLLEGSVQRAGDVVRIAATLTNGKTGFNEWSESVERKLTDIFALQSEIAATVASAMSVHEAVRTPMPGGTRNAQAYEDYLRGKALYNLAKDEATDRQALALFENAIAADPDFALAHAARSRVLSSIASSYAPGPEIKPTFAMAIDEGQKAVALAPKLAEAHLALGFAMFAGHLDIKGSRPSYDAAYRYGSGDADTLLLYALYAVRARRPKEARAAIERAVALDPLNPRTHRAAGTIGFVTRDYAGAIGHFRRALALNPAMGNANAFLGLGLTQLGRFVEARAAIAKEPSAMFRLTALAILDHRAGNQAAAEKSYQALVSQVGDAALYQQAEVMAQFGRADAAMALLMRARQVGDSGLTAIASDPLLDPVAGDPRFIALVRDLGFG